MNDNHSPKRKNLLINPLVQRKILGLAALVPTVITIIHMLVQKYILASLTIRVTLLLENNRHKDQIILILEQMGVTLTVTVLLTSIICVILIYTYGLKQTHKIAGPIMAAMSYLQKIKIQGVSGPLRFREGDHFEELSNSLNETLLHLGLKYIEEEKDPSKN